MLPFISAVLIWVLVPTWLMHCQLHSQVPASLSTDDQTPTGWVQRLFVQICGLSASWQVKHPDRFSNKIWCWQRGCLQKCEGRHPADPHLGKYTASISDLLLGEVRLLSGQLPRLNRILKSSQPASSFHVHLAFEALLMRWVNLWRSPAFTYSHMFRERPGAANESVVSGQC